MKREDILQILGDELDILIDIQEEREQFTDSNRIEISIKLTLGNKTIATTRDYFRVTE